MLKGLLLDTFLKKMLSIYIYTFDVNKSDYVNFPIDIIIVIKFDLMNNPAIFVQIDCIILKL